MLSLFLAVAALVPAPVRADAFAQGNAEFALDIYGRVAAEKKGNVFCSPYSISSALAMTSAGAAGETARQMARALRLPEPGAAAHAAFGRLTQAFNAEGKEGRISLVVANALWGQRGFAFKKEFLDLTSSRYGAGLHEFDFQADPDSARKTINAWVEKTTRGKIKGLVPVGLLERRTRLVLTNAVFFKGRWAAAFQKGQTKSEPFSLGDGGKVDVPLMHQTGDFSYTEGPDLQGLELPYQGGSLSLVILLPGKPDGLGALEKGLSESSLREWLGHLAPAKVTVSLPRFKAESQFQLGNALQAMGMRDAFSQSDADFSGMDGRRDLYIGAAIHKAFVEVNEEGTQAAAATAVVVNRMLAVRHRSVDFRADHPFLFLIRNRATGTILFIGRLTDPAAAP